MNATTLINVGLGLYLLIVLFTSNFITFCAAAEVSRGSDGDLGDVMGGGDDRVDGDEEEREREWMNEMKEMLQRADESRETEDEYRKRFGQISETDKQTERSDTTTSPESTGLESTDFTLEKLMKQLQEIENNYHTEAPSIDEEEKMLEAENYKDVAENSLNQEFEVAAPDGTMEKIYVQENVTMMEKPNSNETILLAEDKMQVRNETTNEIIYEASNENEFVLDEKFDVSTLCTSPSDCNEKSYCPYWNYPSSCTKCKSEGDQCFDNRECCQVKDVGGYFRKGVCFLQGCSYNHDRGEIGVQCASDMECKNNECCAYYPALQTNFCTRLPKLGEMCLFNGDLYADAGLTKVLARSCPSCSSGLQCNVEKKTCDLEKDQQEKQFNDQYVP